MPSALCHVAAGLHVRRWLVAVLLLWAGQAFALPPAAVLRDGVTLVRPEGQIELLHEAAGEALDAQAVSSPALAARWTRYAGRRVNLSRQPHPVWIRFAVRNEATPGRNWVLGIEWPLLSVVDFHLRDPATGRWEAVRRSGTLARADRDPPLLRDPAFAFPLAVPPGATREVLVRAATHGAFLVPLVIAESGAYQARRFDTGVLMGVLFGVLGVMFLYNAALAAFTGERMYGVYSGYLLTVLLYELALTGHGALYLWGGVPWLVAHGYELFACASFLTAALFFRHFLDLAHQRPAYLRRMNTAVVGYWCVALVLTVVWPTRWLSASVAAMGLVSSVLVVYVSAVLIAQGNRYARYFGAAWFVVIVGTLASVLTLFGVLEGNAITAHAQPIGFVLEVLLLSVALADRIKRERAVREAAQREALELTDRVRQERDEKIRAQAHAIALQAQANEELERRVLDRTRDLEQAMAHLAQANVQLATLSVTDALTGVHNRRYFDEVLEKEYLRSDRTGVPLAVALVDIDHFKRVNDTFGHLAGDDCLRLVAAALSRIVARATDLVARYGGEEFALVLPGTDARHALQVAERVRAAVADIAFVAHGQRVPVRVSIGVVARVTSASQPMAAFVSEADVALYRAKADGRDRVALAAA